MGEYQSMLGFISCTVVISGGLADCILSSRTPTRTHVFPGLPHGFRRFGTLPSSTVYDRVVAEDIQWCLGEDDTPKLEVHYGQAG
jgi:hypothetical protein